MHFRSSSYCFSHWPKHQLAIFTPESGGILCGTNGDCLSQKGPSFSCRMFHGWQLLFTAEHSAPLPCPRPLSPSSPRSDQRRFWEACSGTRLLAEKERHIIKTIGMPPVTSVWHQCISILPCMSPVTSVWGHQWEAQIFCEGEACPASSSPQLCWSLKWVSVLILEIFNWTSKVKIATRVL